MDLSPVRIAFALHFAILIGNQLAALEQGNVVVVPRVSDIDFEAKSRDRLVVLIDDTDGAWTRR